jgi:hypothetical protein
MPWWRQHHQFRNSAGGHGLKVLGNQRMVPVDLETRVHELTEVDEVVPGSFQLIGRKSTWFVRQLLDHPLEIEVLGVEKLVEGGHPSILDDGRQYLVKTHGREVPLVDADVDPALTNLPVFVHVATQSNSCAGRYRWIELGRELARVGASKVGRRHETGVKRPGGRPIVVAQDQSVSTVQTAEDRSCALQWVEAEVADVYRYVVGPDSGIESFDHLALHIVQGRERTAAQFADVAVPVMFVAREPGGHGFSTLG